MTAQRNTLGFEMQVFVTSLPVRRLKNSLKCRSSVKHLAPDPGASPARGLHPGGTLRLVRTVEASVWPEVWRRRTPVVLARRPASLCPAHCPWCSEKQQLPAGRTRRLAPRKGRKGTEALPGEQSETRPGKTHMQAWSLVQMDTCYLRTEKTTSGWS